MKKLALSTIVLLIAMIMAIGVQASATVDMTGIWTIEVITANGTGSPTFELEQDGSDLSGTYSGRYGEEDVTGKVEGNQFEINYESSGIEVTYSGTVDGDSIKGDVDFSAYGTGTFTGKR